MGFRDGMRLTEPRRPGKAQLIYLQAYGEMSLQVVRYVTDTSNPDFGKPLIYRVSPGKYQVAEGAPRQADFEVHASRVLHVAEFLDAGDNFGMPRLEPVYNNLLDLNKIVGSAAETFWRNSNPGLALSADADAKFSAEDMSNMKEQAAEFEDGMRRILAMRGITPTQLGAANQTADPATNVNALLDLISGATGIPKRILTGSERGELASSQDSDTWASRIDERQNNYAGPSILIPFCKVMVETGNIIAPKGQMWAVWPESGALSPKDQALIGETKSRALVAYANSPNAAMVVPYQEFRRDFLDLPPESEYEIEDVEVDTPELDAQGNPIAGDVSTDGESTSTDSEDDAPTINQLTWQPSHFAGPEAVKRRLLASAEQRRHANAKPRTLYVRRDLLNAEDVRKHYKAQGLGDMTPAGEMHVTIAYSRAMVDWMKVGSDWTGDEKGRLKVVPGGARMHELFGKDKTTLVLLFNCSSLSWRHEDIKNAGASDDHPDYQPHISITYNWTGGDINTLKPYTGELLFGPEVFEEIREDWKSTLKENVVRLTEADRVA